MLNPTNEMAFGNGLVNVSNSNFAHLPSALGLVLWLHCPALVPPSRFWSKHLTRTFSCLALKLKLSETKV